MARPRYGRTFVPVTTSMVGAPSRRRKAVVGRTGSAAAGVFVLAVAARLSLVYLHGGSLADSPSYDTGVYYAAADAFIHGRLPYRDFTLVHPPGIMLALTPFAMLGRLVTDHVGFAIGGLSWMMLGGVNALLVLRIGRRLQFGAAASVIGALTYALWFESVRTEFALRLEPFGNFLVLVGVLAFVESSLSTRRWVSVACGAALGAAASVKIWYAVPLVLVVAWHVIDKRPRRQTGWAVAGAVVALGVIDGPFFVLTPRRMWHMVVTDQFGRSYSNGNPLRRLANIASAGQTTAHAPISLVAAIVLVAGAAFLALCVLAWRSGAGRLPCVLILAQLAVLLSAPTFYLYYPDYLTPALALTVGAAAAQLLRAHGPRSSRPHRGVIAAAAWLPALAAATSVVLVDLLHPLAAVSPAPDRHLQTVVASARCVQSDSDMALIQLDVLSRDLENGCRLWVDVLGRTYEPPLKPIGSVAGRPATRATYPPWQQALQKYLLSADAVVVLNPRGDGMTGTTLRVVDGGPLLASADGYRVHKT